VALAKSIKPSRHVHGIRFSIILLGAIFSGFGLWQLERKFPPPINQDIGQQFKELKNFILNNPPNVIIQQPSAGPSPVRSYLAIADIPKFAGRNGNDFRVGDPLAFNFAYYATGPNAIYKGWGSTETMLEPNDDLETLKDAYNTFIEHNAEDEKSAVKRGIDPKKSELFTPGMARYNTAFAWDRSTQPPRAYVLTQTDIDNLKSGSKIAMVFITFEYEDEGKIHHLWYCNYLQPPAQLPGTWHGIYGCPSSD
jgi:hypothetical protein